MDNQNQADRNRALGTFTDLEAFLGSGYATAHNADVKTATGNFSMTAALMQHLAQFTTHHVAD